MAKKQFKTESKRILDMMINSVYTHREIFLRELISNASDAIDKLYYRSMTDDAVQLDRAELQISLETDKAARTLRIRDNGCGMSRDDLTENLGVIAHSGTLAFREGQDKRDDIETIGQFGVGFYSAFMVSKKVEVLSRPYGEDAAWLWESEGVDGYSIREAELDGHGTVITLTLKDNTEDERYDEYLESYTLRRLVKKHSDYIRYPIVMDIERSRRKEGAEEGAEDAYETVTERETLNSMTPLWRRPKNDISEEEYAGFYQDKFGDYEPPLLTVHYQVEGSVTYNALLFVPAHAPMNFYSRDFEKGLQLYSNGVLIMDKAAELLGDHFGFVRGLVDSPDVSLNISREVLQHDRQLKFMAKNIEKKLHAELLRLLENDREKYEKFYAAFGLRLKYGLYADYGVNKDTLVDLVLYHSLREDKLVSLGEYVDAMPEEQKSIYYVSAESPAKAALLPQTERVRDKGFDILCLTDDVDEFTLKMLNTHRDKPFASVSADELELDEAERETQKQRTEESKPLLEALKAALEGKVEDVVVSARLRSHPVCLTSEGELSLEMEKVLGAMPIEGGLGMKAKRVLELNAEHPVFETLKTLPGADDEKLKVYAGLLYQQALLIEGLPIDDPVAFSRDICELMT